jgi:hypothetical protein
LAKGKYRFPNAAHQGTIQVYDCDGNFFLPMRIHSKVGSGLPNVKLSPQFWNNRILSIESSDHSFSFNIKNRLTSLVSSTNYHSSETLCLLTVANCKWKSSSTSRNLLHHGKTHKTDENSETISSFFLSSTLFRFFSFGAVNYHFGKFTSHCHKLQNSSICRRNLTGNLTGILRRIR